MFCSEGQNETTGPGKKMARKSTARHVNFRHFCDTSRQFPTICPGQGHDASGAGAIWQNGPRGPGHLQQHHQPQAPTPCPTRNPLLLCKADHQLRAVGSYLMHIAQSCMASACRMCPSNRPGRLRGHLQQPAELPGRVPVSRLSA